VASWRRASPLTAAGPSRIHTGFPNRAPVCGRETTITRVAASRVLSAWLPVAVWAGLIFTLSSIPDLGTGLGGWDLLLRKLAHATEYAVLGLLLVRALGRPLLSFAVGTAYAVTDEIHQAFVPGRVGSPLDVAIDAAGVAVGILVALRLRL
jgi:VanZ like family